MTVELISSIVECLNSSGQNWSVGNIELISILGEHLACLDGFLDACSWKSNISPSSESVLFVPAAFSVPEENNFVFLGYESITALAKPWAMILDNIE